MLSTNVAPSFQTLESISSVTNEEPFQTTTVLSVPAAMLARLIVVAFIVTEPLAASVNVTLPSLVNAPLPLIAPVDVNVPSRSMLSLKSIADPPVFE